MKASLPLIKQLASCDVKVMLTTELRNFASYTSGHHAIHLAGDDRLGVGILITRPYPTRADLEAGGFPPDWDMTEPDYVREGDWVIYASPNQFANPYIIDVRAERVRLRTPKAARLLGGKAEAILATVQPAWADELRKQMPASDCARCQQPCALFMVSKEEWARVGPQWKDKVLCRDCYDALTSEALVSAK